MPEIRGCGPENLDLGLCAVSRMLEAVGDGLREPDVELLLAYAPEVEGWDDGAGKRAEQLFALLPRGFIRCAARGTVFVPIAQLGEQFDSSIDSRYRGASASFRRFAVAYWSLKVLEGRVGLRFAGTLLQQLLLSIERRIAGAFFPEREEDALSALERASLQRSMLREAGPDLDIEEFLLGNPLLLGDPLAD